MFLRHQHRFLFVYISLLALLRRTTCQAPPTTTGAWKIILSLTTSRTFSTPSSCLPATIGREVRISLERQYQEVTAYKYCNYNDLECCPPGYPTSKSDVSVEPLYVPGQCPSRYTTGIYSLAGNFGERVHYCCPSEFTLSNIKKEAYCASIGDPTPVSPVTAGIPATTSFYQLVHVAKPIFIIASEDLLPNSTSPPPTANATETGYPPGVWNSNGLKVGIALAVSVPVIAILAYLCRAFVLLPRRLESRESRNEAGENGRRPTPAYALEDRSRRRASQCGDGDSIMTEPPPPYARGEEPPPRISGERQHAPDETERQDPAEPIIRPQRETEIGENDPERNR